ncbi:hypothetical protein GWN90_30230, partial [candidate division KSB1 bacterium]|nr:hypothetical protein [candidate division KSB1 bacterium]
MTDQAGIDGVVDTAFPQRFTSAGATFSVADIGRTLVILISENNNGGTYIITNYVDPNTIEVSGATFISETAMFWAIIDYGSDLSSDLNDTLNTVDLTGKNSLMICHENIQWNQMDFIVVPVGADTLFSIYYYDGFSTKLFPNSVTDLGGNLEIVVNSLIAPDDIGTYTNRSFSALRVR